MKHRVVLMTALMGLAVFCSAQKHNTLRKKEKKAGWVLLFNGKDMEGWNFYKGGEVNQGWKVTDGVMNNSGKGSDHGGDIITSAQFADFELYLEWKAFPESNSGVFYRVPVGENHGLTDGPEYQLIDDKGWPSKLDPGQYSGANYAMHPPEGAEVKPLDQWNTTRIIVNGSMVQHYLNGKKVVEYEFWTEDWKERKANCKWKKKPHYGMSKKGHIGLQDHGGLTQFRNIKIREL